MNPRVSKWNERHARAELARPLPLIERIARAERPGLALDLACGLGRHALLLAEHGWTVTAVDASEVAVERLRASAGERRLQVEAVAADLESPDFSIPRERFDLICVCFYLNRKLITRIQEGTRAGGLAAFALPMHDGTPGLEPMNPDFLVEAGELRSWFTNWNIQEYEEKSEASGRRRVASLIARRPERASTSL